MKILGLTTMGSSAAALLIDGVVVVAIEEERLTRLKNDGGFPYESIKYCLDAANLNIQDIEKIAVYWQPWRMHGRMYQMLLSAVKDPKNVINNFSRGIEAIIGSSGRGFNRYPELRGSWFDLFRIKSLLKSKFGNFNANVRYYDHHKCHASSVYYIADVEDSICLTYDGGGETDSTVVYAIENGSFNKLKAFNWPNSLGHFYSAFTGFLGFRMLEGEYKMMGLSPYGTPRFKEIILDNILIKEPNGGYFLDTKILNYHSALKGEFSQSIKKMIGEPRKPEDEFTGYHEDVAASVQAAYEDILMHILSWARKKMPHINNLCVSGGCGLNVSANGKVVLNKIFNKVLIPPAPHDAGCSIGAAFLAQKEANPDVVLSMPTPYLGKCYTNSQIVESFEKKGLPIPRRHDEKSLISEIVSVLSGGGVVAWFQGASEFGPRALGNRSFLADPRFDTIRGIINQKIKKRELFRPFAPSCKEEVMGIFFEINQKSPYMNVVAKVHEEKKSIIPAVTHIDGTARIHTVSKKVNPLYWELLDNFESKTGVGVLLNTSFNIQEPIVESPDQAIDCFLRSSADCLAIGSFICDDDWRAMVKLL